MLLSLKRKVTKETLNRLLFRIFSLWWRWWDSNPWPPACRAGALPTELHPQIIGNLLFLQFLRFCAGRTTRFKRCLCTSAFCAFALVGPSGLEPPTSCLSGTRSNLLSYDPMWLVWFLVHTCFFRAESRFLCSLLCVGIELSSRAASSQVFSPLQSLTSVFGMGTGGPSAFVTPTISVILHHWILNNTQSRLFFRQNRLFLSLKLY